MKKILLFMCVFILQMGFSQITFEGNKLIKNGETYKLREYKKVFENPEAQNYFAKAKTNAKVSEVFALIGGAAIGVGVTRAILGNPDTRDIYGNVLVKKEKPKYTWGLAGIGLGVVGIGIPFALAANKNAKKAIAIENGETSAFQPYFKLETAGNGLALSYNF